MDVNQYYWVETNFDQLKRYTGSYKGSIESLRLYLLLRIYLIAKSQDENFIGIMRIRLESEGLEARVSAFFNIAELDAFNEPPFRFVNAKLLPSAEKMAELRDTAMLACELREHFMRLTTTLFRPEDKQWKVPMRTLKPVLRTGKAAHLTFEKASIELFDQLSEKLKELVL